MKIRQEQAKDYDEIRELVKNAFATAEHTDGNEFLLVDKLRKSDGFISELALVAEAENQLIGHILFTKIKVGEAEGIALAPLSVLPSFQKKGVGTALMNHAHTIAKNMGYEFSVVLGSETYYPKVGYQVASKFGIKPPFDVPNENYMVLFFNGTPRRIDGTVAYVKEMQS
ncbi:MAG: N-acetyltransferase [Bacillota bacterium]